MTLNQAKAIRRYLPVVLAALVGLGTVLYQTRYTTSGAPIITTPRMKKILDEGKMIEGWVKELNESFVVDPAFAKRQPAARAMLEDEAEARFRSVMQAVVVKGPRMDPYWGQSMVLLRQSLLRAEQYHLHVRKFIELDLQGLSYLMTAMRQKAEVNAQLERVGAFTKQQLVKLQDQQRGY